MGCTRQLLRGAFRHSRNVLGSRTPVVVMILLEARRQVGDGGVQDVDAIEPLLVGQPSAGSTLRRKMHDVVSVGTGIARSPASGPTTRLKMS